MATQVRIDVIFLQEFDGDKKQDTLTLTFGEFSGEHTFVLDDDDAQWNVGTTQPCEDDTVSTIRAEGKDEVVEIKPLGLTWILNTASGFFSINGGDYKITFSKT